MRQFAAAVVVVSAVFFLNLATNQRGAYDGMYVPASKSETIQAYPMWGYPLVLRYAEPKAVQYLLCVLSVCIFAAFYPLRWWMVPYFIPYGAICSMLGPEAFSVPLVAIGFMLLRRSKFLAYGLMIGLAYSFRAEALSLILLAFVMDSRRAWLSVAGVVPFVLAWFMATSTLAPSNSGMVIYGSLGRLPGNPWGIIYTDAHTIAIVESVGLKWGTIEGDEYLRERFVQAVKSEPWSYARKLAYNVWSFVIGGFYTGEYVKGERVEGFWNKLRGGPMLIDYILSGLFRVGLLWLVLLTLWERDRLAIAILILLVIQMAIFAHEQRYSNVLILPLLAIKR